MIGLFGRVSDVLNKPNSDRQVGVTAELVKNGLIMQLPSAYTVVNISSLVVISKYEAMIIISELTSGSLVTDYGYD